MAERDPERAVNIRVNGQLHSATVEPRTTLADFVREECALTGTHLACEHGACGACTVLVDGEAVRSCLMFAVQAEDCDVRTVEDLSPTDGVLHPVQAAFREHHGLQCGFCTPGFVMTAVALLGDDRRPTDEDIVEGISGNLCRCTGYQGIIAAMRDLVAAGSDAKEQG